MDERSIASIFHPFGLEIFELASIITGMGWELLLELYR
jgi:hypothetical protein